MRYSLISKFQGAFLGQVIGKQLSRKNNLVVHSSIEYFLDSDLLLQEIVNDLDNELKPWEKYFSVTQTFTLSDIALSLLPWILFYHDNCHQLQHLVTQVSEATNLKHEDREIIEVWIYKVVLALRDKLDVNDPIQQITSKLKLEHPLNSEHLQLVAIALSQGQSSKQILEILLAKTSDHSRIELLFSLYLFLSIPEEFSLILKRAIAVSQKFPNTVSLTGTLAGAYNSLYSIPSYWLNLNQNHHEFTEIMTTIKKLFSFWSGVYNRDNHRLMSSVIAIPNSLQPRSNLKIISQEEYRSK
ncbi:MAG: hypothetical protein QNJ70_08755 [Xenococcaceae cyanobacterium MO_207.B15]|nr:hypothetical protein [Xenococcaceae cyanobacterium MO_207.B15]